MAINNVTFTIPSGTDGDTFGGDDTGANVPTADRTRTGQVALFPADFSSFHRYLTPTLLPGSFITKAVFRMLASNNYVTRNIFGGGRRKIGILEYDGLWNVGGFSVANYALREDLPRPTENNSDVINTGILFQDQFFGGEIRLSESAWTGLTAHSAGEGFPTTDGSDLVMVEQLMAFIDDPAYEMEIGITVDGLLLDAIEDDLRIVGANLNNPMTLQIEWWDPVTPSIVAGELLFEPAVSGELTWEPAVTGRATSQPAVSGMLEVFS